MRRTTQAWVTATAVLTALLVTVPAQQPQPQAPQPTQAQPTQQAQPQNPNRHPHFDDGGTLAWHTKLTNSQQAARKADKIILVEVGAKT